MDPHTGFVPLHARQMPPPSPHSVLEVPAAQTWPLVQHPVPPQLPQLRVPPQPSETAPHCPALHVAGVHPQTPAVPPPPHVLGEAQSALPVHPHVPFDVQAWPAADAVQLVQAPPLGPHAPAAVPGWQLVPSQQAPLHASPPEQEVPHFLPEHACPVGQSPAAPQPHVPPSWQT
jgi:hypothetical protein